MNDTKEFSQKDFDIIFDKELKTFLSLEKSIWDSMTIYENEPNDNLKNIILKMISNAKDQDFVLLELASRYLRGELQIQYSNKLGAKLNDLHDLEEKLYGREK